MIKIIDNVLTQIECNELIELGLKNSLVKANTLGENMESYRIADNTWIWESNELTKKIEKIVQKESGLPIQNQEKIHIVKYNIGGEYKPHHDFFHPNTDYYESSIGTSGQRVFSFLFYLNDDFTGGETDFPNKKIKITPKLSRLLIWRNLNEDGSLDYESLHSGLPVQTGTKYIAIVWVRENSFASTQSIEPKPNNKLIEPIHMDLGQIMSINECEQITQAVFDGKDAGKFALETDVRYYKNSLGGNVDLAWSMLRKYLPFAEEKLGIKLKEANPYIRIYRNGSTLNPHTDRVGLDWTISVCLFSNINYDWQLVVKDTNGKLTNYPTKLGYASLVNGSILEHWREPLECNDGEYVIQMFLHYTNDI
jgi:prolyl 4-hydroxylase